MKKSVAMKIVSFTLVFIFTLWAVIPRGRPAESGAFAEAQQCSASAKNDYRIDMPQIGAESAIVIDADSRSLLFAKGESIIRGMASTTKIMTALVAIENCDPDAEFAIPAQAVGIEGSSVYLIEGERLTLRELLYCLLLESGNDAATAIAICVGGSVEGFVNMMNSRAEEMGLKHTHFTNPHGLNDPDHHTTAHELALITAEAMEYPLFCEITATKSLKVRRDGKENGRILTNHNKLLRNYEGAMGVKTGYTIADGKCLVSAARRNGLTLIAVTLKDNSPVPNHKKLLDHGFESFEMRKIAKAGEISSQVPLENGVADFVTLCNSQDVSVCLPKGAKFQIELHIPDSTEAPVSRGEALGEARVLCDGKEVYIIYLEISKSVDVKEKSFWEKLFGD